MGTCIRCSPKDTRPVHSNTVEAQSSRLMGFSAEGKPLNFLLAEKSTVGRHPNNQITLPDREVSKEHALLERSSDGGYTLKDLNSSNGTFVNGRRVRELKLRDGDEIAFGNTRLTFRSSTEVTNSGVQAPKDLLNLSKKGVTVVASAASMPAFIAQLDQALESEFRPAEQQNDVAALKQDYEKLRIAHEFHRQVGRERDQKSLFEKILNVAFQLLAADNGVLFLVDDKTGDLTPALVKNRTGASVDVVVSETVLERATQTRQAVLTADAIIDSRFSSSESIVAQGIRSAMAVPLLVQGALKGLLFLDSRARANAFSEKDLKILSAIASQAAIALENAELGARIEQEAITRAELSRFLSPAVADMVVQGQVELFRVGRLAEVTVLFADIRGFTSMAENESPQETVSMLNAFFSAMAGVVFKYQGNLDKFIGDCVMAVWGPPSQHADDASRALKAALEMQIEVNKLNAKRMAAGQIPLEVGVGVNTGQAVVGYMGSNERHEFTAIGDSVNTASRLCGLAKGGEIIASAATLTAAGSGFRSQAMSMSQVKGKEKGIFTYRIMGVEDATVP
jgi:adenylate cyclase